MIRRLVDDFLVSVVWFISRGVVAHELASGELITIDHGATYLAGAVGLVRLKGGVQSRSHNRLIELLRETGVHWVEA